MYNYIKGKISLIKGDYVVIENNNIGYQIKTPNPFNFALDQEVTIYTYLLVREDIFELYGFETNNQKDLFLKLISVKGLGPKGACAIIASDNVEKVVQAINSGDSKYLQRFPGIGPKASQQIILDLHGKINVNDVQTENPKIKDIKEALKSLGYNASEIKSIIPVIEKNIDLDVSSLIKLALKSLLKS